MAAVKHKTPTARLEHLEQVAKMDRRGYSGVQIAKALGVCSATISNDLKAVRKMYIEGMAKVRDELIAGKIAQFEEIRREAWEAYERSKQDSHKEVEEFVTHNQDDGGGSIDSSELRLKRIVTKEGRLPLNQYLQTVLQTLAAERELLGLDEAKKVDVSANVVHWDSFFQLPEPQMTHSNVIGNEVIEAIVIPTIVQPEGIIHDPNSPPVSEIESTQIPAPEESNPSTESNLNGTSH